MEKTVSGKKHSAILVIAILLVLGSATIFLFYHFTNKPADSPTGREDSMYGDGTRDDGTRDDGTLDDAVREDAAVSAQDLFSLLYNGVIQTPETKQSVSLTGGLGIAGEGETRESVRVLDNIYQKAGDGLAVVVSVNSGGSGVFYYLTLYTQDAENGVFISRSAEFLGDRILVNFLQRTDYGLEIMYRDYAQNQSFSEAPFVTRTKRFTFTDGSLTAIDSD